MSTAHTLHVTYYLTFPAIPFPVNPLFTAYFFARTFRFLSFCCARAINERPSSLFLRQEGEQQRERENDSQHRRLRREEREGLEGCEERRKANRDRDSAVDWREGLKAEAEAERERLRERGQRKAQGSEGGLLYGE